jgi:hypothetical protein
VKNHDYKPKNHIFFQLRREARKFLGYFVWKITILRQKIIFFPILEGRDYKPKNHIFFQLRRELWKKHRRKPKGANNDGQSIDTGSIGRRKKTNNTHTHTHTRTRTHVRTHAHTHTHTHTQLKLKFKNKKKIKHRKRSATRTPQIKYRWTHMLAKGKKILLPIRHLSCYS